MTFYFFFLGCELLHVAFFLAQKEEERGKRKRAQGKGGNREGLLYIDAFSSNIVSPFLKKTMGKCRFFNLPSRGRNREDLVPLIQTTVRMC